MNWCAISARSVLRSGRQTSGTRLPSWGKIGREHDKGQTHYDLGEFDEAIITLATGR
jgi:hypothetical protein